MANYGGFQILRSLWKCLDIMHQSIMSEFSKIKNLNKKSYLIFQKIKNISGGPKWNPFIKQNPPKYNFERDQQLKLSQQHVRV